jgi:hypothetical protein
LCGLVLVMWCGEVWCVWDMFECVFRTQKGTRKRGEQTATVYVAHKISVPSLAKEANLSYKSDTLTRRSISRHRNSENFVLIPGHILEKAVQFRDPRKNSLRTAVIFSVPIGRQAAAAKASDITQITHFQPPTNNIHIHQRPSSALVYRTTISIV